MKQNEEEWVEYQNIMEDVIKRSGLDKSIFFDLRGNHDNFGVPAVGGSFDFFSKYSINGQLGRSGNVNSVTLQTSEQKHLFVGFDSTMSVGLRGPTNLFGHPTDQLILKFWKEPKRYSLQPFTISLPIVGISTLAPPFEEFWEWEMGDWRKSRAMRILAIDRGHVSYVDIDFKLGTKKTIILPTFPLDSCLMSTSSSRCKYECQVMFPSSYDSVRALVFSVSPIVSVMARIFDTTPGKLNLVLETSMTKLVDNTSRGDFYTAPWNYKAFEDPSADRYWLQIEATDILGRSTLTELRPFSVNSLSAKLSWTWKEFFVMGCQWAALYYPILWSALYFIFFILLIPKALLIYSKKQYTCRSFIANKGFINGIAWVLQELCRVPIVWYGMLGYILHLILLPWFIGQVFTDGKDRGYMTYMGWVVKSSYGREKHEYVGSPDIMVVVLPHLFFVVLPCILVTGALAAEREICREHFLLRSGKKEDDYDREKMSFLLYGYQGIEN
uniref:Calcineurin-like phosphoesterase domain-containing protein n=1 Tax=Fagus sylvatica TaxID=28930 RepID=A0A2N9EDE2_FAGSY